MRHILSVLVENKSGVLSRVTGMISRRGFNIESLTVAPTEDESLSRMTIIVEADEVGFEQITKQLHKLVSVYKISDFTDEDAVERELVLFKVQASPERRHEVIEIADVFRAKVVDVGKNTLTIEATGVASKLDAMENLFRAPAGSPWAAATTRRRFSPHGAPGAQTQPHSATPAAPAAACIRQ